MRILEKPLGVKLFPPVFVKIKLHQNSNLSNILCCTCNLVTKAQKYTGGRGYQEEIEASQNKNTTPRVFPVFPCDGLR